MDLSAKGFDRFIFMILLIQLEVYTTYIGIAYNDFARFGNKMSLS